jgi:siroheme synthase-like protein
VDYYPVFLDLRDRPVLLVGGGRVAQEKVGRLLAAGARLTIVSPDLVPEIRAAVDQGSAAWISREFAAGDTAGMFVVVIATNDGSANRIIATEARSNGALVNAADDAANCDFILPAVVEKGRLTLAASTGGSSPAMARWLRERIGQWLSDDVVALADLAAEARVAARHREVTCAARCPRVGAPPPLCCRECPNKVPSDRWQEAMNDSALALLRAGQQEEARAALLSALGLDEPLVEAPWWQEATA